MPRSLRAVSRRPLFSMRLRTSSTSIGIISAMGRRAKGAARSSSIQRFLISVVSARPFAAMLAKCSAATAPKVFWAAFSSAILSSFFFTEGSSREASCLFASSRFWRALASDTVGYAPKESSFSLPAKRYLSRHSLLPLGCTTMCNPPPSESLYGFSCGFDERTARSVSTGGISLSKTFSTP